MDLRAIGLNILMDLNHGVRKKSLKRHIGNWIVKSL